MVERLKSSLKINKQHKEPLILLLTNFVTIGNLFKTQLIICKMKKTIGPFLM